MELAFDSKEVRRLCEDKSYAEAMLGPIVAESLRDRLADLLAVDHIFDLPIGKPTAVQNSVSSGYQITLADQHYLLVGCNPVRPPKAADGSIDWNRVRKLLVIQVEKR